jgi:hypothetical protein
MHVSARKVTYGCVVTARARALISLEAGTDKSRQHRAQQHNVDELCAPSAGAASTTSARSAVTTKVSGFKFIGIGRSSFFLEGEDGERGRQWIVDCAPWAPFYTVPTDFDAMAAHPTPRRPAYYMLRPLPDASSSLVGRRLL